MRTKAIKDLDQLRDGDFFEQVSIGLEHIFANCIRLYSDALVLSEQNHPQGSLILNAMAKEEAAKFLILLDAVRFPRIPKEVFTRQLYQFFYKHLARGIYAEYYNWCPATFGEVKEGIERERKEYYLDGPSDVDWIFRNSILQQREESIYVDYVETEEGHAWIYPRPDAMLLWKPIPPEPAVMSMSDALKAVGFTKSGSLRIIADIWRPIKMTDDFHWQTLRELNIRTIEAIREEGLLIEQSQDIYGKIVNGWLFPLFSINLGLIGVSREELCHIQSRWSPELW
jgi:AbiV family abortive infection protein